MSSPKFKLRSALHEPKGTYSKKEILQAIRQGKFTGEEEIAAEPYARWQKLAAHPAFYDAFLKRLYEGQYQSPDASEPSQSGRSTSRQNTEHSRRDRATRQAEPEHSRISPKDSDKEEGGKTRRIGGDERIAGGTIQQSVIDELFSEGEGVPAPRSEEDPAQREGGTDLIRIDQPLLEPTLKAEVPLPGVDVARPVQPEENSGVVGRKKRRDFRRRVIWLSAAGLLLVLLFQMGKGEKRSTEGPLSTLYSLQPRPHPSSDEPLNRAEKIKSLSDEGDLLYANDTRLGYLAALEVYRDALGYKDGDPVLLGKVALTGARLLADCPQPERLQQEIERTIEKGRLSEPQFSAYFRTESLVALTLNKLDEAKKLVMDAVETDPTAGENALAAGEVQYAMGDLPSAKQALEEATKALPLSARAHYLAARTALDVRDENKARAEAIEALKVNPIHPPTYLLLADLTAGQNQAKDAKGLYETAGRLARFASKSIAAKAYYRLGNLEQSTGNAKGAQTDYRLAYYYDPQVDSGLPEKVKGLELGAASLAKLADEAEYGKSYFQEQGQGLLKQGKLAEAAKFYQAAWFLDLNDGEALRQLAELSEKTAGSYEDFRRVMNLYERAIEKSPTDWKSYIKLGLLETDQYNLDRGYKLLTQAAALAPDEADPYVALGKHYYKRQDYNEALNQFLKAAKINPTDSEILYYAGLLRLMFKKDGARDAVRFFYQAYTIDTSNYDALVEWLKLKVQNYEKNFAIKFVRNLMQDEPNNPYLQWAMGEVYSAGREYRRAIDFYHRALDFDNRNGKVRMSLGRAHEAIGDLDKAVAEYRLASLIDRRNSDGFYHAADLLFQMKNYMGAEEVLSKLVEVTPNYPGAHRYLSKIFEIRKQKDQAIAAMKEEVKNNPENYKFTVELAELYMEYEMYDKAIAELTRVANLPPLSKAPEYVYDKIRGYLLLSRCYRAQNKPESAEAAVKLALEIDNSDPELHKELGYVYYALQRDKEGVKEFEFYLGRNPAARDVDSIKALIDKMRIEE